MIFVNESETNSAESCPSTFGTSFFSRGFLYPVAMTGFIQENVTNSRVLALPYRHGLPASVCCPTDGIDSGSVMLLSVKVIPVVPPTDIADR
uniref:Uncharacterized protein n=1 Tax=Arundo donax TaxID=35708 RepID=A0A0A8XXV4_ARUDO